MICRLAVGLAVGLALARPAAAGPAGGRRYALVVGQNRGDPDEETLHYAERDARRIADVLTSLGDVEPVHLELVLAPNRDKVLAELDQLLADIQKDGGATMLVVYYSGHADGRALHLQGERVWLRELEQRIRAASADVKLMILDACRGGGATHVKGGRPAPPFTIHADDGLAGAGIAVITSSTAEENAQESDQLQGSFFTHHLVTGLLGAADTSADQQVSLAEAYDYAYTETLRATSVAPTTQHPTYAFDLRGRREVILTRLDRARGATGLLSIDGTGQYLVFEGTSRGALVAELDLEHRAQLALPAGRYLIRRRAGHGVYDGYVTIQAARATALDVGGMDEVPRGAVIRKGLADTRRAAWSYRAALASRGFAVHDDTTRGLGGALAASLDLRSATLELRLGAVRADDAVPMQGGAPAARSALVLGADLGVARSLDVGPVTFGLGVRAGFDRIHEVVRPSMSTEIDHYDPTIPRIGAGGRIAWAVHARWVVFADVGLNLYLRDLESTSHKLLLGTQLFDELALGVAFYR